MNLNTALEKLATQLNMDAQALKIYADEDAVGGYHSDPDFAKWQMGSIWEVEGKVLYALVRAMQPKNVLNLGVFHGCSCMHIAKALKVNGGGELIAVDNAPRWEPPKDYEKFVSIVSGDALQYVTDVMPKSRIDMVFEDLLHTTEQVETVWREAVPKLKKSGVIISHDASHHIVGDDVRRGIENSGHHYETYLIAPSDCGLAVGTK